MAFNLQHIHAQGAVPFLFSGSADLGHLQPLIDKGRGRGDTLTRIAHRIAQGIRDGGEMHRDAPSIPVFAQALEYIYSETYKVEYANLPMANGEVLPLDNSVPNYVEVWKYRTFQSGGAAKIGTTYAAGSIPRVSVGGEEFEGHVAAVLNAFGYSLQDMRVLAAIEGGGQLEQMYPEAARRAHEEIQERVGWWGDQQHKLTGLLTHPLVPVEYAPVGALNSTNWESKSFDEVFADILYLADASEERTFGREVVTDIYLPRDVKRVLLTKRIENDKQTLKAHIEENLDVTIHFVDQLNADHPDNPTGVGIAVAIKKDKSAAALVTPQPFELLDPQWHGLEWVTICHSRIGGVKIPKPYSITVMPGISGA